jgi:alpha/beta superfamily hydrolase
MARIERIVFPSGGSHPVQLEGMLHTVEGVGPHPAAVVCHPHPLGGGSMHNALVRAIAGALSARGLLALRFNFRGVGHSEGQYDDGPGERTDVAGAVDWLLDQPMVDVRRVSVVGYSFGAWVGASYAQNDSRVAAVVSVSMAAWHYDAEFAGANVPPVLGSATWELDSGLLQSFARPKLLVVGVSDPFAPDWTLRGWASRLPPPTEWHIVPETDHFYLGREGQVGDLVGSFIAGL